MSTVSFQIKEELKRKAGIESAILNLVDFYVPIRGNLRRKRKRAGSMNMEEDKDQIEHELDVINEHVDFDDPNMIDWELIVVSHSIQLTSIQKGLTLLKEEHVPFNKP